MHVDIEYTISPDHISAANQKVILRIQPTIMEVDVKREPAAPDALHHDGWRLDGVLADLMGLVDVVVEVRSELEV